MSDERRPVLTRSSRALWLIEDDWTECFGAREMRFGMWTGMRVGESWTTVGNGLTIEDMMRMIWNASRCSVEGSTEVGPRIRNLRGSKRV